MLDWTGEIHAKLIVPGRSWACSTDHSLKAGSKVEGIGDVVAGCCGKFLAHQEVVTLLQTIEVFLVLHDVAQDILAGSLQDPLFS